MNRTLSESGSVNVNYDEEAIAEVTFEELEYRIDAGRAGTALCVSTRSPGAWQWTFAGEVRFDGYEVRSKALERPLRLQLSAALRDALSRLKSD